MTHLSDYSFLQRVISFGYLYAWYLYRVWTLDKFQCLRLSRFRQGELKSIVTLLIFFMLPFQLYYDIVSCKIKYEEGFASIFGKVFTKPETMWTKADQELVIPTDYSLCIGFSLQTGTLLLLQCFWNYLANSVAKASFMSSKEFLFYIVWTFLSVIIFPVLQYNFSRPVYSITYKEIMPELVYGCELLIVSILGVISHFRFQKLLSTSRDSSNARSITQKIRYFQELNLILSLVLLIDSLSFIILSADGLTGRKSLNAHKFSADFLICNINVTSVIVWFVVILIFHPKPQASSTTPNTMMPPASQEFLSTGKQQFDAYAASPILMAQNSQTSDFMHYSKSGGSVVVPMLNTNHSNYATTSAAHSTATLVAPLSPNQQQQKREDYPMPSLKESALPNNNSNNNNNDGNGEQHELTTIDLGPHPYDQQQHQQQQHANIKRQKSDDSMWLHQSPRGGSQPRSP